MKSIHYREATTADIPSLAKIRSATWGTVDYWIDRISGYLAGTSNPQHALHPRIIYEASAENKFIGLIAGHLTRRHGCEGELEWIDVIEEYRRQGIASEMVRILAKWFIAQGARKICVDPGNDAARLFYKTNAAEAFNKHWMWWPDISVCLRAPDPNSDLSI